MVFKARPAGGEAVLQNQLCLPSVRPCRPLETTRLPSCQQLKIQISKLNLLKVSVPCADMKPLASVLWEVFMFLNELCGEEYLQLQQLNISTNPS